jgi:hypothetical protein
VKRPITYDIFIYLRLFSSVKNSTLKLKFSFKQILEVFQLPGYKASWRCVFFPFLDCSRMIYLPIELNYIVYLAEPRKQIIALFYFPKLKTQLVEGESLMVDIVIAKVVKGDEG